MPSNVHHRVLAPAAAFPETPTAAGPRQFYLGALVHLGVDEPPTALRFNGDASDEVILYPGSTRTLGRGANRPIQSYQLRSLGEADGTVTLEFTEEPQPDRLVWHATGPQGPAGPQGEIGPAGPPGADAPGGAGALRVRAFVGANPINIAGNASVDLVCDQSAVNVGGGYDPLTGEFTCPANQVGDYLVHASVATAADPMELELRTSSDGGFTWTPLSRSPQGINGARLADLVPLAAASRLKFVVRNPGAGASSLLAADEQLARCYLTIARVA